MAHWWNMCSRFHAALAYVAREFMFVKHLALAKKCVILQTIKRLKLGLMKQNCTVYFVFGSVAL